MTPKLHTRNAAAAALLALVAADALAVAPDYPPAIYREGEVLVKYRAGASAAEIQALRARFGLLAKRSIDRRDIELLALPGFTTTAAALAVLRTDPAVEHAEPNFRRYPRAAIPNDAFFDQQWGLRNTGQANFSPGGPAGTIGADLNMIQAWDANGDTIADRTGDPSVIVAVIDDAFQIAHPDLAGNFVPGHNFIFCQDPDNPNPVSSQGTHGTLVSGCVGARGNNGSGVAGVAWNASLMPLKFGFDLLGHLDALEFARDNGAKIINASFGGPGFSQIERDTIDSLAAADILYVTAAGNDDSNTDLAQLSFPANYDAENIVVVAATNRQDNIASFSQYGPTTVDVAAPGLQIVTTKVNSGYSTHPGSVSGTSFSSPYVAGVAALLKSHVAPTPDYLEMKARLIESGSAVSGANPKLKTAGGRVDADKALDMAAGPALVVRNVSFSDSGNNRPDPGETLNVSFVVRNLWLGATGVTATLAADSGVMVTSGVQALGDIASQGEATATFQISVEPGVTEHRYVTFMLTLSANSGAYTATRGAGAEISTLTDNTPVTQPFDAADIYDDFHAWHFDVPASGGGTRTLLITTSTAGGEDVDLLVKRDVPPRYSITVGINPETQFGFFCTSSVTADCQDPTTLVSARQDGVEAVSLVDPPVGTYHLVVVNFVQETVSYVVEAKLVSGDIRPDPFNFVNVTGVPANTNAFSNTELIAGIDTPAPITVAGGQYSINGGGYTALAGTISNGQTVQLQGNPGLSGFARVQLTIGGVTDTFFVNSPPAQIGGDPGELTCPGTGARRQGGGRVPLAVLAVLMLATLARRLLRAA